MFLSADLHYVIVISALIPHSDHLFISLKPLVFHILLPLYLFFQLFPLICILSISINMSMDLLYT